VQPLTTLLLAMPLAFLAGSIPFSLLLGLTQGVDIRTVGSCNVGATNLGRALGFKWFLAGFTLDAVKGFVPVIVSGSLAGLLGNPSPAPSLTWAWLGVVVASVLGHMFSPWVKFKGGKGVATSFGAFLGAFPILTLPVLIAFVVWCIVLGATRFMGLASSLSALSLPIAAMCINIVAGHDHGRALPVYLVVSPLAALVIYKHRGNLQRTLAGTEPRCGRKKQSQDEQTTVQAPVSNGVTGSESASGG
jgi:acyl phosphate:glycerol-3-phosphate acyltransferase